MRHAEGCALIYVYIIYSIVKFIPLGYRVKVTLRKVPSLDQLASQQV